MTAPDEARPVYAGRVPEAEPAVAPDVLAGSSIALPVPGGIIRMTYGGGLTVEPAAAPSVAHAPTAREAIAAALAKTWIGNNDPASFEPNRVAGWALQALTDAGLAVLAPGMWETKARCDAAEAEVARLKEAQRTDGEVMYANGDEITTLTARVKALEAVVEAADERIAALLQLDAAMDDQRQAEDALTEADAAVDAATDAELEAAKAHNAAKAKLAEKGA